MMGGGGVGLVVGGVFACVHVHVHVCARTCMSACKLVCVCILWYELVETGGIMIIQRNKKKVWHWKH